MKDCFDSVTDVIGLIDKEQITEGFSARIWPHFMPAGLFGNNIVVKMLSGTNQAIQQLNMNVTLHVSNIISGGQSVCDIKTFSSLSEALIPLLNCQYKNDFWTEVLRMSKIYKELDGSYFLNITVKYRSLQTNYKNI